MRRAATRRRGSPGASCACGVAAAATDARAVVKSLGQLNRTAKAFSGATVLADGGVALILDVAALVRVAAAA